VRKGFVLTPPASRLRRRSRLGFSCWKQSGALRFDERRIYFYAMPPADHVEFQAQRVGVMSKLSVGKIRRKVKIPINDSALNR